jgi:hypothetical protein
LEGVNVSAPTDTKAGNELLKCAEVASCSEEFFQSIKPLTQEEVNVIEMSTVGQSDNPAWLHQRKARITASNFYRVSTRMDTIEKDENTDPQKLIDSLLGINAPSENIYALKYGRNMEAVAKHKYLAHFKKEHKDTSYRECGLFICQDKPYLGASPDLLVECSCCGKGLLEIKCPYSIVYEVPSADNLSYLQTYQGQTILKEKCPYFAQIQGQMALTNRSWCHFFVYTQKGHHMQKIIFDFAYWTRLERKLSLFYKKYFSPKLVEHACKYV